MAARNRLQIDERRAQLLELGLRLFSERSYDEVSIDDIAEAAGVSKGLLYHYFGSKRDFYVATVQQAAAQFLKTIEPDEALEPTARALGSMVAYLTFVEDHAGAYVALLRSGVGTDPEVAGIVEGTRVAIVDRMMANMGFTSPRPVFRFIVRSWIGLVEAASLDWIERREVGREVVIKTMLDTLRAALSTAIALDPEAGYSLPEALVASASAA